MVDKHIKEQVMKQVPEQVREYKYNECLRKGLILERQKAKEETERLIAKAILQERGNIQAQISTQIENAIANVIPSQVDASVRSYMSGHILHVHPAQSQTSSVPEQQYQLGRICKASEDIEYDVYMSDEVIHPGQTMMKFQRSKYHQDIMEEVSLTIDEAKLRKMADEMLRQRCTSGDEHQYHIDQMKNFLTSDIVWESRKEILYALYLKKGNSGPEKIVLSLHKFPAIIFNDDDIEEQHPNGVELKIVARRANDCIVSITEPDYKNLNKNDIEDIYLLIMNGKVPDYADTGLQWSLSVLENNKKENGDETFCIYKFCDATLNRVLEGLKSYNNDVKYGYVQKDLTKEEAEYLKLFEEEIEERLKHRRQMRRWEMFVNRRPLGPRRERPE
ncbi:hypothetical protein Tco_1531410 [Tanacetum coccineum]